MQPNSSGKLLILTVPQISTRVSSYSQAMVFSIASITGRRVVLAHQCHRSARVLSWRGFVDVKESGVWTHQQPWYWLCRINGFLSLGEVGLTHWGRATHICVSKLPIIASNNGLSPGRRQAIIWTSAGIFLIGTLGTNFSEIVIEIRIFSFKKMGLKMSSGKWQPFCLGLNVLTGPCLWVRLD